MQQFESPVYNLETHSGPLYRSPVLKWLAIIGAWIIFGLIYAAPIFLEVRAEQMGQRGWRVFLWGILSWLAWAPLTPLLVWFARRFSIIGENWRKSLAVHVPVFVVSSVLHTAAATFITVALKPFAYLETSPAGFWQRFTSRIPSSFAPDLLVYGGIIGICYAIDFHHKYREREYLASQLEAQLANAQLETLRMQLHPHFLFNTLNSIVGLVRDNRNQAAIGMLVGLSDLLRQTLEHSDRQEVELKDELKFIKLYLELQQMRFSDRLRIQFDIDPKSSKALVPNLLLQPITENALRHGVGRSTTSSVVGIRSEVVGETLRLTVFDDGAGLPSDWQLKSSTGIGLANTVARLEQLYGANHRFDIRNRESGGVEVLIELPLKS